MMNNDTFETSDLSEITYLLCKDIPLVTTTKIGQRVIFHFGGNDRCRKLLTDILYGRDMVSLSQALEQVRRARHIMHSI